MLICEFWYTVVNGNPLYPQLNHPPTPTKKTLLTPNPKPMLCEPAITHSPIGFWRIVGELLGPVFWVSVRHPPPYPPKKNPPAGIVRTRAAGSPASSSVI